MPTWKDSVGVRALGLGSIGRKKGRLNAPLVVGQRCIFERKAKNDAAIDRAGFQLERVALAVFVNPSRADFVPVGFVALLRDVPGQIVGGVRGLVCGVIFACHDLFSFVRVGLLTPSRLIEGKGSEFMVNTAGDARWCGQTIEDRRRIRSGISGCLDASHPDQRGTVYVFLNLHRPQDALRPIFGSALRSGDCSHEVRRSRRTGAAAKLFSL